MKKLKLEDTCLTIEQAKELKALNINMDNCLMEFCSLKDLDDYHLLPKHKYENNFIRWKYIPTLTNTEMLEMLPKYIKETIFGCNFDVSKNDGIWTVVYRTNDSEQLEHKAFHSEYLRDSIFEMIKYLKTNKII